MKIFASIVLLLIFPLALVIALLIYMQSRTNVIFKQERIGLDKNEFIIYKFKTMENQKITFIGKFLRKLGLDEIPQLINIIKGDMSFVGPRPLTHFDIERLEWNKPEYSKRWSVKPGITGLAQLSKICNAKVAMKNDLCYVENKSFLLDSKLILKTVLVPIIGKQTK